MVGEPGGGMCIRSSLGSGVFLFATPTTYGVLPFMVFASRVDDECNVVNEKFLGLGLASMRDFTLF